jgi:hypothetical protein
MMIVAYFFVLIPVLLGALVGGAWLVLMLVTHGVEAIRTTPYREHLGPGGPDDPFTKRVQRSDAPIGDVPSGVRRSEPRTLYDRRIALWGTFTLAALSMVGMFVQVYLIAGVLFGEDWLDLHKDLGKLVHLSFLLTFGAAFIAAWPSRRWLFWPFMLATLGSIQAFLAGEFDLPLLGWGLNLSAGNGALHALHGALVPIVFVIALVVARQAWTALGIGARTQAQTTP